MSIIFDIRQLKGSVKNSLFYVGFILCELCENSLFYVKISLFYVKNSLFYCTSRPP